MPQSKEVLPPPTDYLLSELNDLLATANQESSRHVDDDGECRASSTPWPSLRAALAAFTLEAI